MWLIGSVFMIDLNKAKIDPASVFNNPHEVLENDSLSHEAKVDILSRWAYDEREIEVAEEENMTRASEDNKHTLDEILKCLLELGVEHDQDSPPTKQG